MWRWEELEELEDVEMGRLGLFAMRR